MLSMRILSLKLNFAMMKYSVCRRYSPTVNDPDSLNGIALRIEDILGI